MVSSPHAVCSKGYYIAFISTEVETSVPENEIQVALQLLGPIEEKSALFALLLVVDRVTHLVSCC